MKKNVGGEKIRAEESFQKTEKHFSSSIKLHIAGKTAGPIGLKFFVVTQIFFYSTGNAGLFS